MGKQQLGLGEQLLGRWVAQERPRLAAPEEFAAAETEKSELERLRRENPQLRIDNEYPGKSRGLLRIQAAESECFELMEAEKANYPVQRMARLRRVSSSSWLVGN